MDDHLLTRADQRILRDVGRNSEVKESSSQRYVPAYIDALIRRLAETYSQKAIAHILNQQLILRPNGLLWQQFTSVGISKLTAYKRFINGRAVKILLI